MSRKLVFNGLIIAAAGALGVYLSRGPWVAYKQQQQQTNTANAEMRKAEESRNELIEQKANLDSYQGKVEAARNKGYRKPGEVPVEVEVAPK